MPASSVTVAGQRIVVPGAYSQLDVSRAQSPGVLSAGTPCLIGEAEGGKPLALLTFNSLNELRATFRSGDLLEAADILYDAIRDNRVLGRPTTVHVVKTNQDTQSSGSFNSASGVAMDLTSVGYGAYTERISVNILSGTLQGVSIVLQLDDYSESGDNIGGGNVFSLKYTGSATVMTATTSATGLAVAQTFTQAGLDDEVTTGWTVAKANVVSDDAYDSYQKVTIYGLDGTGADISATVTLNGTTAVDTGAVLFTDVTGASIDGLTAGSVTVDDDLALTAITFAADLGFVPLAGKLDVSGIAADVGQVVRIEGRRADGTPLIETVTLNGTTVVTTTNDFTKFSAVQITGTTTGNVVIADKTPQDLLTIGAGASPQVGFFKEQGLRYPTDLSFAGILTLKQSSAETSVKKVVIRGTDSTGAVAVEVVTLAGVTPVLTTNSWKTVGQIEMGLVENAETTIFTCTAFSATVPSYDNFDTLEAFVDAKPGFVLTQLSVGDLTLSDMDYLSTIDIKTATASFTADLAAAVAWVNATSSLVTAVRTAGGTGQLLVLANPQYLIGGTDVAATIADYSSAFTLLEAAELDYFCPVTDSASVHAFAEAHAAKMATATGRSERMAYVGVPASTTKTALKALSAVFGNSRHVNMLYQEAQRYDTAGVLSWFAPKFIAVLQMGAQASARRGVPLTFKSPNLVNVRQHSTLDPKRDAAELIDAGISNIVPHPNAGFIWQRTVTTYQRVALNAFQESSANDSLNASVKDLRGFLEVQITGEPDVDVSTAAIKRFAEAQLERQLAAKLIAAYRNVTVNTQGTRVEVSYEVAPVLPRNFVVLTTHVFELAEAA